MAEFNVLIDWRQESDDFSYEKYDRDHFWKFGGGKVVEASAAPDFKGRAEYVNPEEAFIASLASCHMLTFLAIASFKKLHVKLYQDEAVGIVEKNEKGKMAVTKVILKPFILFANNLQLAKEELMKMHEKAHKECFISNSVLTDISIEPVLARAEVF